MTDATGIAATLRRAGCVFAEDEAALLIDEAPPGLLDGWVRRRVTGEPLEYIVGWALFDGLRIAVDPGVFVPRRRTEAMVDAAVSLLAPGALLLDLCCGSGAVAAAVHRRAPGTSVHAADVDPIAVACARRNLPGIEVALSDCFAGIRADLRGRFTVITANTPYVPTAAIATMPPEARDHEPVGTLDGGVDGLDVQRRVAAEARQWLRPGGALIVEVSQAQVEPACGVMSDSGLVPEVRRDDERDATLVVGYA